MLVPPHERFDFSSVSSPPPLDPRDAVVVPVYPSDAHPLSPPMWAYGPLPPTSASSPLASGQSPPPHPGAFTDTRPNPTTSTLPTVFIASAVRHQGGSNVLGETATACTFAYPYSVGSAEESNLRHDDAGFLSQKTKERLIVAAKVLVVVALIAGLIAASVFTFGAAGAAVGAIAWGGSAAAMFTSFATTGALFGAGIGLAASAVTAGVIAYNMRMHEYTKDEKTQRPNNLIQTAKFLGYSLAASAAITAYGAASGASEGMRYGLFALIIGGVKIKSTS